jgi:membrane protein required for colicin V production
LSIIDILIAIIILTGAFAGFKDGFIVSLFSVLGVIIGLLGGFKLMGIGMVFLADQYNVDKKVLPYIAFSIVFVIIVACVSLLGRLIKASFNKPILGQFDGVSGAFLGIIKTTFLLSILLWIGDSLKIEIPESWTNNSRLQPVAANFALKIARWIGGFIPIFDDIF